MKLTKRKGFNFFRSYYDVYNELEPKDKVAFMDALLDMQFQGVKPKGLTGMAKFAYISQTNSIESQVKGYEDKTKTKLNPNQGGKNTPTVGGKNTPTEQVEEKVEEEVQSNNTSDVKTSKPSIDFDKLLIFINETQGRNKKSRFKVINNSVKKKYIARLKDGYTTENIKNAIINSANDNYHKEQNYKYLTPEFFSRSTMLDKHGFKTITEKQKVSKKNFISNIYNTID